MVFQRKMSFLQDHFLQSFTSPLAFDNTIFVVLNHLHVVDWSFTCGIFSVEVRQAGRQVACARCREKSRAPLLMTPYLPAPITGPTVCGARGIKRKQKERIKKNEVKKGSVQIIYESEAGGCMAPTLYHDSVTKTKINSKSS